MAEPSGDSIPDEELGRRASRRSIERKAQGTGKIAQQGARDGGLPRSEGIDINLATAS